MSVYGSHVAAAVFDSSSVRRASLCQWSNYRQGRREEEKRTGEAGVGTPMRQSSEARRPARTDGALTLRIIDSVWSTAASSTSYRRHVRMRYSG